MTDTTFNNINNTNNAPTVRFFPADQHPAFASFGQSHTTPFGHVQQDMYFSNLDTLKAFADNINAAIALWEQDNAKQADTPATEG